MFSARRFRFPLLVVIIVIALLAVVGIRDGNWVPSFDRLGNTITAVVERLAGREPAAPAEDVATVVDDAIPPAPTETTPAPSTDIAEVAPEPKTATPEAQVDVVTLPQAADPTSDDAQKDENIAPDELTVPRPALVLRDDPAPSEGAEPQVADTAPATPPTAETEPRLAEADKPVEIAVAEPARDEPDTPSAEPAPVTTALSDDSSDPEPAPVTTVPDEPVVVTTDEVDEPSPSPVVTAPSPVVTSVDEAATPAPPVDESVVVATDDAEERSPPSTAPSPAVTSVDEPAVDDVDTTPPAVASVDEDADTEIRTALLEPELPETEELPVPPEVVATADPTQTPPADAPPELLTSELPSDRPTFDVVRIAADGGAVIAGRARPGAVVRIYDTGELVDEVVADRRGNWVSIPIRPFPGGSREITLSAQVDSEEPILSAQVVLLAVPERQAAAGGSEPAIGPSAPLAILLPREGDGFGRLLQAPGSLRSAGALELEAINYDRQGTVELAGKAHPGAAVRVYVDNRNAIEVIANDAGGWVALLQERLEPGDYAIRVDELTADGSSAARVETPFRRTELVPLSREGGTSYVVVQPGNSLWRIARRIYGDGNRYAIIFNANEDDIADPDMIFPGQVFEVPDASG